MARIKNIFSALTRTERVIFLAAILAAGGAGIALIAMAVGRFTVVVPTRGGNYTEGVLGQPTYINPILAERDADKNLIRLLFENVNALAEKIDADQTGRVYRVRLKEGLTWSDGKKITTDDVIFTVQKIQDPETRSPLFSSWQGVTANRLSELELQFNLVSPYPFFRDNLSRLYPIPKHLFADTPPANWRLSDYNLKPVGSGPFKFSNYQKETNGFIQTYALVPNEAYFGDKPYIDQFGFQFFTKADDMITAFNNGAIDGFADFNPETINRITRSSETASFTVPGYYAVFLNQNQNLALKDVAVRQALIEAVDRVAILRAIFGTRGHIVMGPVVTAENGPDTDPLFKPTEAAQLLDKAGWTVAADGIRSKTIKDQPLRLEFDLIVPQIPFLLKTADLLAGDWKTAGIAVHVAALSPEDITNRVIKNREYQAILFGNVLNPLEDLYPFWHSNERFYPGLNLALYTNKKADDLMDGIRREPDQSHRADSLAALRDTIANDFPAVFLYAPNYLYVSSRDLKGLSAEGFLSEPADRYANVTAWHLRTTRVLK